MTPPSPRIVRETDLEDRADSMRRWVRPSSRVEAFKAENGLVVQLLSDAQEDVSICGRHFTSWGEPRVPQRDHSGCEREVHAAHLGPPPLVVSGSLR